ncbi:MULTISPECIES: hypothetical protein [unclassified Mesorhizobium]|uniref:hypothetical protein n=1 Tax=unclassified Mesorhizobium TaxID=325217 RepID=UPI000BAE91D8|nr:MULTISPECIES: hypothetical protein [unclassified Mesorhizobium]PBB23919.1 hypothetical protein CK232_24300 [Mesorhizobium sp. WSM4304]PBB72920.1 hypothetical protein CK227_25065 [Mesorhizobium sp. WSM4308]
MNNIKTANGWRQRRSPLIENVRIASQSGIDVDGRAVQFRFVKIVLRDPRSPDPARSADNALPVYFRKSSVIDLKGQITRQANPMTSTFVVDVLVQSVAGELKGIVTEVHDAIPGDSGGQDHRRRPGSAGFRSSMKVMQSVKLAYISNRLHSI